MLRFTRYIIPGILTFAISMGGYFWLREGVTSSIYRAKLDALAADYMELTKQYNEAIKRTAVTELEVTEKTVAIIIRTADGEIQKLDTPFNPAREIYVDYVVGNGRIWIRRIFDSFTRPDEAMVIDPVWEDIDWATANLDYGKAVYRALEPGIWAIQVSGNGSLSLEKSELSVRANLEAAPRIRSYDELHAEVQQEVREIGPKDIWTYATGGNP